jgi:hypothetical protein
MHVREDVFVLVLERLKPSPEVEASPDFKISGRSRWNREMRFRIEHEHDLVAAMPLCFPLFKNRWHGQPGHYDK